MDHQQQTATSTEGSIYDQVPTDFPTSALLGAVSGAQAKLLLTEFNGKFYSPGTSPPERFQRWDICEDLARQLSEKSLESKASKRAHMSEIEILQQYYDRLEKTGWVTDAEGVWVIHRVSAILSWPKLAL